VVCWRDDDVSGPLRASRTRIVCWREDDVWGRTRAGRTRDGGLLARWRRV